MSSWKVKCLDSKKKLNEKLSDMETNYDELKEKNDGLESELEDLKGHIILEHINGFQKGLWQTTFFCKELDVSNSKYDVNQDVVDDRLVNELDSSPEEEVEKVADTNNTNHVGDRNEVVDVDVDPVA